MESVNIKKLAQLLNLSIATVSKALRDSYDISQETKDRVMALAKELNYQPNPHASFLRKQNSKTIAVIIPEIANNYFTLAINGIESVAQEKGYHVIIYLSHEDYNRELAFTRLLTSGRADGVLISVSSTTTDYTHLHDLQNKGLPIVFFDRVCENFNTVKVTTDDYQSGYLATSHLIDQGCKRIAHLAISQSLSIGNKRAKGYIQALQDNGFTPDESLLIECTNNEEQDATLIKELLQQQKPDGIFAAVERYAIASYELCESLGLNIPEDVKVISFSNLQTASLLNPSLSTITQPAFEIGREAAAMLLKKLEKKNFQLPDESIVIQSKLITRKSTMR
ncbi:LacI family transcriptional regulator [Niastella yeongjuensis]|uniref:LacI family transcriptional regulator n=1 Tax=Niastella yeongjuensis TaxID=354355 RepID=A0A1V9EMR4_9BACT|nr:LacI family DNA-binding transcriptional regulator [Niastella yeongjuensis]OQP47438.1 LacI family transcriptional regulator [Niastella yeongjuensis]SEN84218.1 transcriptional regulator, LacI family [Niastella yeongjuensis]